MPATIPEPPSIPDPVGDSGPEWLDETQARRSLSRLASKAIGVLDEAMDSEDHSTRLRAALAVLRSVGLDAAPPVPEPPKPLDQLTDAELEDYERRLRST